MTELQGMADQVAWRMTADPDFAARVRHAIVSAIPGVDFSDRSDPVEMYAIGCIGMALHVDDVAAGRWPA